MSFDANAHRSASLEGWEEAASGWVRRQELLRELAAPVSDWMIDAIAPRPGQRVLELAAGLGETALRAAELVAPHGGVVISDQAEAMLDGARARAVAMGLSNVEFQVLNAEWIDLPVASVDSVLCRWGYMLMADPAAALTETRRVLRPGGSVALAVWDSLEQNPWALAAKVDGAPARSVSASSPAPPGGAAPAPGAADDQRPGPFALGDRDRLGALLQEAGFTDATIDALDLTWRHASFDAFWEASLDLSRSFHDAVLSLPESEMAELRGAIGAELAHYRDEEGGLAIPGRTLVARASA